MIDTTSTTTKQASTDLYKVTQEQWIVVGATEARGFLDVDKACDYLMELGVQDEQIDLALIDMVARGTTRANFGINGVFIFSDGAQFGQ